VNTEKSLCCWSCARNKCVKGVSFVAPSFAPNNWTLGNLRLARLALIYWEVVKFTFSSAKERKKLYTTHLKGEDLFSKNQRIFHFSKKV